MDSTNMGHCGRVIEGDEFIKNLWAIHQKVKAEGYTQVRNGSATTPTVFLP